MIQKAEAGQRPTDAVIKKIEKMLEIELMVEIKPDLERQIPTSDKSQRSRTKKSGGGMTLGDYLEDI